MSHKVCMIAIQHSAKDDRIFYKESISLRNGGYDVTILCMSDENGNLKDMKGNILNSKNESSIVIDGVKIVGVPKPKSIIEKTLNKANASKFYKKIIEEGIRIDADVYHAHEPQSLYIAFKITEKTKAKVVFDAHEPWLSDNKKDGLLRPLLLKKLEYLISANQITRGDLLFHQFKLKSEVIYNAAVPSLFKPVFDKNKLKEIVVCHEGNLWFDRGLENIIEALRILKSKNVSFKFRIVGEVFGKEKKYLEQKKKEYHLNDIIEETGWLDYEAIPSALKDCSIGLISNTELASNSLAGPANKFFNYLAYGIACVSYDIPETTQLLNDTKSGITIVERTPEKLAEALLFLIQNPNTLARYCENSIKAFDKYNWDVEEKKLLSFYKNQVLNESGMIKRLE